MESIKPVVTISLDEYNELLLYKYDKGLIVESLKDDKVFFRSLPQSYGFISPFDRVQVISTSDVVDGLADTIGRKETLIASLREEIMRLDKEVANTKKQLEEAQKQPVRRKGTLDKLFNFIEM